MKHQIAPLLCTGIILLGGCTQKAQEQVITEQSITSESKPIPEASIKKEQPTKLSTESTEETISTEESAAIELPESEPYLDDTIYIGEYLDSTSQQANLEIAKGDDGKYIIQITIYRLTFLEDGIGELTTDGMNFIATDAAGNPISGIITVEDQIATVTFINSTWDYLKNYSSIQYTKSSDTPNLYK